MGEAPTEGSIIEVTVYARGREGDGLAKLDNGLLVIVKGGRPYTRVKAKIIKSGHTYCIAEVLQEIPESATKRPERGGATSYRA